MKNCKICEDYCCEDEKCHNRNSQYFDDYVNEYMVCREFIECGEQKLTQAKK